MDTELLITVGLDTSIAEALSSRLKGRMLSFSGVPNGYSIDGRMYVESQRVAGRLIEPRAILFYSYFDSPESSVFRRALALSNIPTFPDVRRTLPLDDKTVGLVLALSSNVLSMPRGYVRGAQPLAFEGERVFKWGNAHCGEGKAKGTRDFIPEFSSVVEPFIAGVSERILFVGQKAWHLRYESDDWRKNVKSTVTVLDRPDLKLVALARQVADHLHLDVAGIDFITNSEGSFLLEVNAYPGFDEVPEAQAAFVAFAEQWWKDVLSWSAA